MRKIDLRPRITSQPVESNIVDNPYHLVGVGSRCAVINHEMLSDRVQTGPDPAREALVNDHDPGGIRPIRGRKGTTLQERDAQCSEILRGNHSHIRAVRTARRRECPFGPDRAVKVWTQRTGRKRCRSPNRNDARQRGEFLGQLVVVSPSFRPTVVDIVVQENRQHEDIAAVEAGVNRA